MNETRISQLAGLAIAAFGLVLVVVRARDTGLSRPPTALVVSVTVAAVGLFVVTRSLQTRLRGTAKPVVPLAVARLAALGIASAVTGALVAGGWLGLFADRLSRAGAVSAARHDAVVAGLGACSGVLLSVAGQLLQRACRSPKGPSRLS